VLKCKEYTAIGYVVQHSVLRMGFRSTDETAKMHHRLIDAKWGKDGPALTASWMKCRFDHHFMTSQGIGTGCRGVPWRRAAAGRGPRKATSCPAGRSWPREADQGDELLPYFINAAIRSTGLGLKTLHPFGKGLLALVESR
jgi:hypothetical protein